MKKYTIKSNIIRAIDFLINKHYGSCFVLNQIKYYEWTDKYHKTYPTYRCRIFLEYIYQLQKQGILSEHENKHMSIYEVENNRYPIRIRVIGHIKRRVIIEKYTSNKNLL